MYIYSNFIHFSSITLKHALAVNHSPLATNITVNTLDTREPFDHLIRPNKHTKFTGPGDTGLPLSKIPTLKVCVIFTCLQY